MVGEQNDLEELSQEIRKLIDNNKKFIEQVFDEDFDQLLDIKGVALRLLDHQIA